METRLIEGPHTHGRQLPEMVRSWQPHVAIVSGLDDGRGLDHELFSASPWVKLLHVQADGRTAELRELRPHTRSLGELTTSSLARAIHEAGVGGQIG